MAQGSIQTAGGVSLNYPSDMTAASKDQWRTPWPEDELQRLSQCPVCGCPDRSLLHAGLVDKVFDCAPGVWRCWKCAGCGVGYLDPRPSPDSIYIAYSKYYTHITRQPRADYRELGFARRIRRRLGNGYTNWRFGTSRFPASRLGPAVISGLRPFKLLLDNEFRHLPKSSAGTRRLLDVGCGNGSFLSIAQSCGWDVVGLDPDPQAVINCANRGVEARCGAFEQFDSKEPFFDAITLCHVIEHVHDPVATLKSCWRLLKPGGCLWLETPNIDSYGHSRYGGNWRGLEPPRHLVLFNWRSLVSSLSSAGFSSIERKPIRNPLVGISEKSEAIAAGLPSETGVRLALTTKIVLFGRTFVQSFNPADREFITLVAYKPCGQKDLDQGSAQ
jgi:2-polyprenyl-3-methyl-5-hydroxy-6-metoxy-1,4-benzoquinol methylase